MGKSSHFKVFYYDVTVAQMKLILQELFIKYAKNTLEGKIKN